MYPQEADHLCLSLEGIRELPRDKIGHFIFITWQKTLAYLLVVMEIGNGYWTMLDETIIWKLDTSTIASVPGD